jgi:hypothetical protein
MYFIFLFVITLLLAFQFQTDFINVEPIVKNGVVLTFYLLAFSIIFIFLDFRRIEIENEG